MSEGSIFTAVLKGLWSSQANLLWLNRSVYACHFPMVGYLSWSFSRWSWVGRCSLKQRMMEVVVTTGTISHAKLQSNQHHQQTNIQFFTGRMPFLSPNQHCQSTEGKISYSMDFLTLSSPGGFPTLSLTTNSSWLPWGRVAIPLISPLMPIPHGSGSNNFSLQPFSLDVDRWLHQHAALYRVQGLSCVCFVHLSLGPLWLCLCLFMFPLVCNSVGLPVQLGSRFGISVLVYFNGTGIRGLKLSVLLLLLCLERNWTL